MGRLALRLCFNSRLRSTVAERATVSVNLTFIAREICERLIPEPGEELPLLPREQAGVQFFIRRLDNLIGKLIVR